MIHFDLPKEKSSIIKVIGIGGGGSNAVNHMFADGIEGVNFIICNTDAQALAISAVPNKVQLGPHLTQGLGAGANPEIGKQATEESFEEIRKILEVNTKMAFITTGMGGGTGTGGAPIVAKICRELNILTVGIITTPFSYEGKKRLQQADEGINNLKEYVDTLLIISNDKLRHQFGNLPFKAAFAKADNILATAAKCITDVINQHGHINVDFADVCTAMRNGGVAILGAATAAGENRAQQAIELALASPLLNDNNIHGAKWILLNINSAEGEYEHTIDEMDTIQAFIQKQSGEDCDVILGVGYDNTLGDQLGVTIIATGFEQKSIIKENHAPAENKKEEKIVLELGKNEEEKKLYNQPSLPFATENAMMPALAEPVKSKNKNSTQMPAHQKKEPVKFVDEENSEEENNIVSGGYLARPSHIYAEPDAANEKNEVNEKNEKKPQIAAEEKKEAMPEMKLVIKEEAAKEPAPQQPTQISLEETEEQKRKAAERLSKLRNISFNVKSIENTQELETVPAYIRRNIDIEDEKENADGIYSGYSVSEPKANNQAEISTINTFLDGKKPD